MRSHVLRSLLAVSFVAAAACAGTVPAATAEPNAPASVAPAEPAPLVAIPNAAQVAPELLSGGQPTPEQLSEAAQHGYRTVISLRTDAEAGAAGEREQVESLGMRFVAIPIAGAADLTEANARALSAALAAEGSKPAIVHCASGNRAGALLALEAFYVQGKSAEDAIALGKRAGLTGLEDAVRAKLQSSATPK